LAPKAKSNQSANHPHPSVARLSPDTSATLCHPDRHALLIPFVAQHPAAGIKMADRRDRKLGRKNRLGCGQPTHLPHCHSLGLQP
jgi:hypothetical protein